MHKQMPSQPQTNSQTTTHQTDIYIGEPDFPLKMTAAQLVETPVTTYNTNNLSQNHTNLDNQIFTEVNIVSLYPSATS